jgi:hypothetical protein
MRLRKLNFVLQKSSLAALWLFKPSIQKRLTNFSSNGPTPLKTGEAIDLGCTGAVIAQ